MATIDTIITYIIDSIVSVWNFLTLPNQLKEDLGAGISDFLNEYDLDLIYTGTIVVNLIVLSYWRYFKDWKSLSKSDRQFVQVQIAGAVMFNLMSILKLLGIVDF